MEYLEEINWPYVMNYLKVIGRRMDFLKVTIREYDKGK